MYVCRKCDARMHVPDRTGARRPESETAEVNTTCNQQMTTQKTEGAEMEGLSQSRGGGERGKEY